MPDATKVGFIGLGLMGGPMARRLIDRGFELSVWNRTPSKAEPLAAAGAKVASTPQEAAQGTHVTVVMVADDDAVTEVVSGPGGIAAADTGVVVDMSTTSVESKRASAAALGAPFVDAPVFGSTAPAASGELICVIGAAPEALRRAEPVLQALSSKRFHLGDVGAGTAMKLAGNMIGAGMTALLANALQMGRAHGLDPDSMIEVLGNTGFASGLFAKRGRQMLDDDLAAGWPVKHVLKDVRLAVTAGKSVGVPMRVLEGVIEDYRAAVDAGAGDLDASAVIKGVG